MPSDDSALPPIETWWPYLTIGARDAVLRNRTRVLGARVRDEIAQATGRPVVEGSRISEDDLRFLAVEVEGIE
ncbi:hypothetical protein [Microbacterium ulmi]|uniref:Uncharacterized protein n=1 Tax=Microbacterium ulmi TaxID=179095 RepID=A0A7Y2Q1G5_9MICO|nr:hypothetical protein [Microbacterium ulmi]NII68911.1 hypothetical protein [Microbacterium ulmi]NNH03895.1 hypothetical protein [Microbacterium ulmi]